MKLWNHLQHEGPEMIALDHFTIEMSVDEKLLMVRTMADSGIDWSMYEVRQISSSSVQLTTDLHELLASPSIAVTTCLGLASASQ